MKEMFADELKGINIKITSSQSIGYKTQIIRLDTNEMIENVTHVHIDLKPERESWATLTLLHIQGNTITHEAVAFDNPGLDLIAIAHEVRDDFAEGDLSSADDH